MDLKRPWPIFDGQNIPLKTSRNEQCLHKIRHKYFVSIEIYEWKFIENDLKSLRNIYDITERIFLNPYI